MTQFANTGFSFDFAAVTVDENPIETFPFDTPLAAEITKVEYKNLAKKDSGEEKIRLIITQNVHFNGEVGRYETIISDKQAYILKQYLIAAGVNANDLSGQPLDGDSLSSALVGTALMLTTTEREWNGRMFRNFKSAKPYDTTTPELEPEADLPF